MAEEKRLPRPPYYQARLQKGHARIIRSENGETRDLCGAINMDVAWATASILNRMHGHG